VRSRQLPALAERDRARKFAEPLLTRRRTGGVIPLYVAPTLSPDGSKIAYISTGSYLRGEVFLDLYLADARTGKRIKRLTQSTTNPDQEEIRYGYSQSAFSPDGRLLAFTAQRQGKDVLYLLDVNRRRIVRRFDTPLEQMLGPTFSPDGKRIVFQGMSGGLSDLYMIDVDGRNLRQLTNDAYGDGKPSWSPDGRTIAFETERGPQTDLETLRFGKTRIALLDLETNRIEVLPDQAGRNINPQWSPDGEAVAFLSDRTGVSNLFLYDLADRQHYQLTDVFTAISSFTAVSPAISWARASDKLAFVYYEDGDYTVWSISDPRRLRKAPFDPGAAPNTITVVGVAPDTGRRAAAPDSARADSLPRVDGATPVAAAPDTSGRGVVLDSAPGRLSVYRSAAGLRDAATEPAPGMEGSAVSVAALLDSAELALPDTTTFREYEYRGGFRPEAVTQPSIGYAQDNFGRGVYGGTTVILGDLLGNERLALAAAINGRVEEAQIFAAYSNFSRRFQYTAGISQAPIFFLNDYDVAQDGATGFWVETQSLARYIFRDAFFVGLFPRNRFTRFELGAQYSWVDRAVLEYVNVYDPRTGDQSGFRPQSIVDGNSSHLVSPFAAYVSDNTLFGYTGPIMGRRYRFEVAPTFGSWQWVEYTADYRRYDPILFNILTLATRVQVNARVGRDEREFFRALGRPDLIRGYDREYYSGISCAGLPESKCTGMGDLIGSRIGVFNAELRFPLLRRSELSFLPALIPPVEGLVFYDAGVAWSEGQQVRFSRQQSDDPNVRSFLTSYGFGVRVNLFNIALLRWDYSIPLDRSGRKGYWFWTIGPSF
jgi:WD40 repeat protein